MPKDIEAGARLAADMDAASEQRAPVDFRRATMLVNDIETPLRIYRDILGMRVYYDQQLTISGDGLPAGEPGAKARLVMLQANHPWVGMLGIVQYLDPPLPPPPPRQRRLGIGDAVFLMNCDDVRAVHLQLREVQGLFVHSEPRVREFPKPGGGRFRLLGMSFFDPNGYFVELSEWLSR